MKISYFILFFLYTVEIFGQNSLPSNPKDVVTYALNALTNGNMEALLSVTENAELRKTKELLDSIQGNGKKRNEMLNQYKSLKSWEIIEVSEHNINNRDIVIVHTKWLIVHNLESNPRDFTTPSQQKEMTLYVDYMLEQFDNQWKIISRRSLN